MLAGLCALFPAYSIDGLREIPARQLRALVAVAERVRAQESS